MALQISATKPLDNKHTQVEVQEKHLPTRYFKVPNSNVDEFCSDYKKQNRKDQIRSTILLLASAIGFSTATFPLWNKINNKYGRIAVGAVASLVGVAGAVFADFKITQSKHNKILNKHNTAEFYPKDKEFPIKNLEATRR